jgi:protocatechuate 3,4-dioxygenase beta subunit
MHAHDLGLAHDLRTLHAAVKRREALAWIAALGAGLAGCGGGGDATGSTGTSGSSDTSTGGSGTGGSSSCAVIPEETAGPYPGDGSNSNLNALALSGILRSDIRSSFAGATGTAEGVPLTVTITLVDTNGSCAALDGYAIYLWHCDREGRYSMYSSGVTAENYLRGVQATDSDGVASFTTIFPGCYAGRMPHMHFEIYRSTNTATSYTNKLKTSQLAFPEDVCETVYATSGYDTSVSNFAQISFATDNVFSDGVTLQTATVTGSVSEGFTATLTVGIAA